MHHVNSFMSPSGLAALIACLRESSYQFITPTPTTHQRNNQRLGNEWAGDLRDVFGWSRPFHPSILPPDLFEILKAGGIVRPDGEGWKSIVRASTLQEDIFLHSAFPTLPADAVFFGPDTYRFARTIKGQLSVKPRLRRVLDIGCGSGAGAVVIAKNAVCAEVCMTDINASALQLARFNAGNAGVPVKIAHGDLFADLEGAFDLIVANPPYLNDPLKRAYRDGGGEFGSALSMRIADAAKDRLSPGGSLILYTGSPIVRGSDRFFQAIERSYEGCSLAWSYEEIDPDVFGEELETGAYGSVDRIAAIVLTAKRPGDLSC